MGGGGGGREREREVLKEKAKQSKYWKPRTTDIEPIEARERKNVVEKPDTDRTKQVAGPIGGGFLTSAKGWRWVFWAIALAMAAVIPPMALLFHESYAPTILARKSRRLRKRTGNGALRSKLDTGLSPRKAFARAIVRPLKMLFGSPIIAILATYIAIVYGYLYLLFATFTIVFEGGYGFSESVVGLSFLGLGVGMFVGLVGFGILSDRIVKRKAAATVESGAGGKGVMKPEYRLVLILPGAVAIPVGFFIYGWTAEYHVHWM